MAFTFFVEEVAAVKKSVLVVENFGATVHLNLCYLLTVLFCLQVLS